VEREGRKRKVGERIGNKAVEKDTEADEAARKMREKVRNRKMMTGASADEFNIA
jgi:hypothetical protein